ncbi:MAG: hypothetical protein JO102_05655 [Elusimicrobia bacterium]|nr:hypothetical protein [Elusimicrobiota bacterium]
MKNPARRAIAVALAVSCFACAHFTLGPPPPRSATAKSQAAKSPSKTAPRPASARPSATSAPSAAAAPSPSPMPTPEPRKGPKRIGLFYMPHPSGDAAGLATILEQNKDLKVTLLFPTGYFDGEPRHTILSRFRVLQSSKQIEIGLTLDNEPALPLLADLKKAGGDVDKWGFPFAWPEDVAAQVARATGRYQKRWGQAPSGLCPPYGAASDAVIQVLRRFRLSWVLGRAGDPWGVRFFGGTAYLVPEIFLPPDERMSGEAQARAAADAAFARPYTFVDGGLFPEAKLEKEFFQALAKAHQADPAATFVTGEELANGLRDELKFPEHADPFSQDLSGWVASPLQKRAWQALSEARQVVETYKNSGRANLNRLDAAIEEMCVAESGGFLLSLAQEQEGTTLAERNFLATIANVYRLAGVAVPENLNTWFADRSLHRTSARSAENDRPFFVEGAQSLTWNDPKGDDNGQGQFTYPADRFPKGAFDLREVTVSWTETDVRFSVGVADPSALQSASVQPLADIYIDLNRLPDAGSTSLLSRRGNGQVERDAAWEYAVSVCPGGAALYQALPSGERLTVSQPASVSGGQFSATFPRRILRGDPRRWRLTVGLGGALPPQRGETPQAIPIEPTAGPRSFGGAPGPRQPPFYLDLLAPSSEIQAGRLRNYDSGVSILPFVEAD